MNKRAAELLQKKDHYTFADLCTIMEILRGEGGCPWDREQTHTSIRNNFIEETYEVIEAIDTEDPKLLREELGDVLLQVVFHARMEEEIGRFGINDVANDICAKLIHRHPHIFSDVQADNTDQVLANWEAIKAEEKARVTVSDKLNSIPRILPALMRAEKVGKKSGLDGADYAANPEEAIATLMMLATQMAETDETKRSQLYGELLFAAVTLGRKLGLEAETALTAETDRRIADYMQLERELGEDPQKALTPDQLAAKWQILREVQGK
ncbi:MAG: nucleoside triphosphate pyrophosphohydrolase [Clostridia bacterium]|nr:nucleoside triphosphate pyrophosphohydrolase [Clostridia bacterium]